MPKLSVVSRRKWGAAAATSVTRDRWAGKRLTIRVHHTADTPPRPNASVGEEAAYMRRVQAFHQNVRGYADIAYSYVIMPSGRVYVGRGWGVHGAHTLNHNGDVGICFAGTYTKMEPTHSSLVAFWQLKRRLQRRGLRVADIAGHRETFATSCPGDAVMKALQL